MKVLLIIPQLKRNNIVNKANYFFPLGIAYISSYLKSYGYDVYTFNGALYEEKTIKNRLSRLIRDNNIRCVGIGGLTAEYSYIKEYSRIIREQFPDIYLVIGGGFVTSAPRIALNMIEYADIGIIGEGEDIFRRILESIESNLDFCAIPNIVYREGKDIKQTDREVINIDINDFPFPDYKGFEFYRIIDENEKLIGKRVACIISSRSCPFKCTFCFHPSGEKYRKRSIDNVLMEIDWLNRTFGVNYISLTDELFVADETYVKAFSKAMNERHIEWECCSKVNLVNDEILEVMHKGGCKKIYYGLESASNRVLNSMKKGITREQIEIAMELTIKHKIAGTGAFIFGDLEENNSSIDETLAFYMDHSNYSIDLNLLRVFPGTDIYSYAVENGIIKNECDYIEKGCPPINISKLTNEEYSRLKLRLEDCTARRKRLPKSISVGKTNGIYSIDYICRDCLKHNHLNSRNSVQFYNLFCENCGSFYQFSLFDVYKDSILDCLVRLRGEKTYFALFPLNRIAVRMYQLLNDERVICVDDRYVGNKEIYCISYQEYLRYKDDSLLIRCDSRKTLSGALDDEGLGVDRIVDMIINEGR